MTGPSASVGATVMPARSDEKVPSRGAHLHFKRAPPFPITSKPRSKSRWYRTPSRRKMAIGRVRLFCARRTPPGSTDKTRRRVFGNVVPSVQGFAPSRDKALRGEGAPPAAITLERDALPAPRIDSRDTPARVRGVFLNPPRGILANRRRVEVGIRSARAILRQFSPSPAVPWSAATSTTRRGPLSRTP